MFWKRMTPAAGWSGLVAFVAAGTAFVVDVVVSVVVTWATRPKPVEALAGLVYSQTPKESLSDPGERDLPWYQSPVKLAGIGAVLVVVLNLLFW